MTTTTAKQPVAASEGAITSSEAATTRRGAPSRPCPDRGREHRGRGHLVGGLFLLSVLLTGAPAYAQSFARHEAPAAEHPGSLPAGSLPVEEVPGGERPLDAPLRSALERYRETGAAPPVLRLGLTRRHPFGHAKPTLRCMPLRVALIKLEDGERVLSTVAGDTESWAIHVTAGGPGGHTPIVVVKPLTERAVTTNLFVTTDRRIYEVLLASSPGTAAAEDEGTNVLEFYYPDDLVRVWAEREARPPVATTAAATHLRPRLDLERIRFRYGWKRDKGFPWEPEAVFDDGAHVYIKLPQTAEHEVAALLFVTGPDGRSVLLNYAVRGGMIITDRVFEKAHFVYAEAKGRAGKKGKEHRLELVRKPR